VVKTSVFFYLEGERLFSGLEANLKEEDFRHAYRVLRLREQAALIVSDGTGLVYRARIISATPKSITVRLDQKLNNPKQKLQVVLLQSITKGDKMDTIVRQSVELGVARIVPVISKRTVPVRDKSQEVKRMQRWKNIIRSAAAQSRRPYLPAIDDPMELFAIIDQIKGKEVIIPWEEEKHFSLNERLSQPCPDDGAVYLLIGPEGGFDLAEVETIEKVGPKTVHLGPRILRTETAAIAALTIIQSAWGDLSSEGAYF